MTRAELIALGADEAYERAMRGFISACEVAEGEDEPLTSRQRVLIGTQLLKAFMGLEESVAEMVRAHELIERMRPYTMADPPVADEVEAWLAEREFEEGLQ